jgi:hypothetical protein
VALEDAAGCPACLSPPGRRGEMMEDELEELVEYAMEELRVLLKPDELKH